MKLTEVKCPNCGANIELPNRPKRVVCEFCETSFALTDENVKTVRHLNGGEITEEQEFINAETYLNKFKNYEAAYKCYVSLSNRYVDDKQIWIGLLRSLSKDFTVINKNKEFRLTCIKYWNNYISLADKMEIEEYSDKFNNYMKEEPVVKNVVKKKKDSNNQGAIEVVTVFFGFLGIHKFMKKDWAMGILYLLTGGFLFIGWALDVWEIIKKHSDPKSAKIIQYIFVAFMCMVGIGQFKYSFFGFIFWCLTGVTFIDAVWEEFSLNKRIIRIAYLIIMMIIAVNFSAVSVPESALKTWVLVDGDTKVTKIEFDEEKKAIINIDGEDLKHNVFNYKNLFYFNYNSNTVYYFRYDEKESKLCMVKDKKSKDCIATYKLEEIENKKEEQVEELIEQPVQIEEQ